MDFIRQSRREAKTLRAEADLSILKADRTVKLAAARELEARVREIEIVVGPSGESAIADWLD